MSPSLTFQALISLANAAESWATRSGLNPEYVAALRDLVKAARRVAAFH